MCTSRCAPSEGGLKGKPRAGPQVCPVGLGHFGAATLQTFSDRPARPSVLGSVTNPQSEQSSECWGRDVICGWISTTFVRPKALGRLGSALPGRTHTLDMSIGSRGGLLASWVDYVCHANPGSINLEDDCFPNSDPDSLANQQGGPGEY